MAKKKVLFIGLVWPEPNSSAAGTRIIQLINFFLSNGYEVHFASAAQKSDYSYPLVDLSVTEHFIQLNDSSFNTWVKNLNPNMVVYDRFMIEEQYGWRIQQECPEAIQILDTEDLHFLRKIREKQHKKALSFNNVDLYSDEAKREIASILRCDLSLIISKSEIEILSSQFKIDIALLYYLPFLENPITETEIKQWVGFNNRKDFVFIGNFIHEPNWQTVLTLKTEIWPRLRKLLPQASLNIFGAYAPQKALQLNNPKERFFVHGRAENAQNTISRHRVLLAPITFGAGVKGKFIDAMLTGTPSITTAVGAEAMHEDLHWNGAITNDWEAFCQEAVILYENYEIWYQAQQNGVKIINKRYDKTQFESDFQERLINLNENLIHYREQNFFGQILKHHSLQSSKYMSLWIEEKNK